jgi:hypothetical protein
MVNIFSFLPIIVCMLIDEKEISGDEFFTVGYMSRKSGKNKEAVKKILHRTEIDPIEKNAIYGNDAWEKVKETPGKGRPPKAKPDPAKKAKK